MRVQSFQKKEILLRLASIFLAACILAGFIWPTRWWGTHFPVFWGMGFSVVGLALVAGSLFFQDKKLEIEIPDARSWLPWLIGVCAGLAFYFLNHASTFYGNGRAVTPFLSNTVEQLPSDFLRQLFSFSAKPEHGRLGVRMIIDWISFAGNISLYEAYRLFDAICGGLFVLAWLGLVRHLVKSPVWFWICVIVGMTSPVLLVYFGHIESYAPVYLILISWSFLLVRYVQEGKSIILWSLLILLIIGIRLHTLMVLFIPSLGLALAWKGGFFTNLQQPKALAGFVLFPLCLLGIALYLFVFKDYNDPRTLTDFKDIDRLFLPVFSPEPPLDRYNLFSLNHILDYLNMMLMWSPAALFLIAYAFIFKKQLFNLKPEILLTLLNLVLIAGFLFAINPLFSMPMDWDLFMFPVPILLVLIALMFSHFGTEAISRNLLLGLFGFIFCCIPVFGVFISKPASSQRIERVGIHVFKTYYIHSSTYLLHTLSQEENLSLEEYHLRTDHILEQLAPYATAGNDEEYGNLLLDKAITFWKTEADTVATCQHIQKASTYIKPKPDFEELWTLCSNFPSITESSINPKNAEKALALVTEAKTKLYELNQPAEALEILKRADHLSPNQGEVIVQIMTAHFLLEDYSHAYTQANRLLEIPYPDSAQALRMNIHLALENEKYQDALVYCELYLKNEPEDILIKKVKTRLNANQEVENLKYLFKRE